jgi:hypothetical protein
MDGTSTTDDARNTKEMYQANYTKNDLRGDPKLDGKMRWRITREKMGTVNWRQVTQEGMDGEEQLERS